jgi:hypothetical protein
MRADAYEGDKQDMLDAGWQIRDEGDGWCLLQDPDTGNVQLVSDQEPDDDADELQGSDEEKVYASGEPCEECGEPVDPMSLPAARSVEVRELEGGEILAASFTQQQRDKLAEKGAAMSDGSFPIRNVSDLKNAIQALGRAKNPDAARRHIIKRARALKAVGSLPATWNVTASGEPEDVAAAGTFTETMHPRHPKGDPKGGEFAPKGTSKVEPRPDEAGDPTRGGKLLYGPGGKAMSRTEKSVLLDKAEGRYVRSHSETPFKVGDLTPLQKDAITEAHKLWSEDKITLAERDARVAKIKSDSGEEMPGSTPETALSPEGAVRRFGGATGSDISRREGAPTSISKKQIAEAAARLEPGVGIGGIQTRYKVNHADATAIARQARKRHLKEGLVRDDTGRYDI